MTESQRPYSHTQLVLIPKGKKAGILRIPLLGYSETLFTIQSTQLAMITNKRKQRHRQ